MKKILLPLLLLTGLLAQSQTYNNEWINYSQTYYKFKVGVTGLYRINQSVLTSIGLGSTPAEQYQLWRNGEQLPIYTSVQTGPMSGSDYIEFWGEKNDGKTDINLFRLPDYQLNDQVSMETDTAAFFLTVSPGGSNLRLAPATFSLPSALPVEPYFIHTVGKYYRDKWNLGYAAVVGEYIYSSAYDQGEGFTSNDIYAGGTLSESFTNLNPYTGPGAPAPNLKVNATGNSLDPRQFTIKINGSDIATQVMDFFDYVKLNTPITVANISSGTANVDVSNTNGRMSIGKTELSYARQFNFGGTDNFLFELPASAAGNYLEISGFNYSALSPVLYDFTNGKRYVCDITNPALVKVVLQPSATARKLLLVTQAPAFPMAVTTFQQRNFINYANAAQQGDFLIITHPALLTGPGGITPVEDYKTYRNSALGGGHNAKIYMIDQLVDQFGLGIKQNPLAVRNFIRWARNTFSAPIKNVFLVGKGLNYIHNRYFETDPNMEKLSFVPTFGYPASDNLLSAEPGLDETPKVPIGRLSVINAGEIADYLTKVKQYEQQQAFSSPLIADKAWMKNVVHAVGAGDGALQAILDTYFAKYKKIIADTLFGANVSTFSKTSTDPVEQSNSARLQKLFKDGLSIITYFGHSSATTLEYNLDSPNDYDNHSKYPLFILLGCNAGNFFNFNGARLQTKETISEKYVLAQERGCIASFASTSLGIVHYLDIYNTQTYTGIARTKYGKTFGELMDESIVETYNNTTQNDFYARLQCEQTTLHGDPALRINSFLKPDYVIEPQLVKIAPSFISVAETHFKVDASFMNIGKAIDRKIVIEAKRTYPDLSTEIIRRDTIPGIRYMDSLSYSIPIVATRDKGANKITITVDADNVTDELYETNNSVTKDFFIFEDEARPVYPYNYSVVNKQNIKLIASTANPFVTIKQYNMELDTTELFNSPSKVIKTISSVGGVLEFTPGITFTDSTVYYWRVSPVPVSGLPIWNNSSFIYIENGEPGFNQSHYFQQDKSSKQRISLNPLSRKWIYDSIGHYVFVKNGVFLTATLQEGDLVVAPEGSAYIRSACVGYSLIFNIFDPYRFLPVLNPTGRYGSYGPPCDPSRAWNFEYSYMERPNRKLAMDFMDSIPDGYVVVVRSINNNVQPPGGFIADWIADEAVNGPGNTLYHKLKAVGFNVLDSFTSARSFIHIYQKNNSTFVPVSVMSEGVYDLISTTKNFKTPDTLGFITSPLFGRAKAWKELKWKGTYAPDVTPDDRPTIDIIGVDLAGVETTLLTGIDASQQDYDISGIDALQYPYLRLKMNNLDSVNYTPYQMRYWMLTYDPVPEGAIAPNIYLKTKDSLELGEPLDFKVAFKNVSEIPFDSLKVKMVITDRNNVPHIIPIPRNRELTISGTPNDTLHLGALINTATIPGVNTLYIEANPDDDQPEQHHFNNFAFRNIYVKPDSLNPLLDVTFDGVHILNRDIVSSKPDIIIKLKDEARWMILDDTSLLTLQVRYPNGLLRRFYFNNDTLLFTPAGQAPNPDNTATLNFRPYLMLDGEYEMIITGKDKSDNKAGNLEYRVIFEVINKPMISNMLNYPNPFTTSTAFVFTITGSEIPQNIKIEIMTITGKIVRNITKDELGTLHIGRNITEFKWDGTDQYGQKLANGIYLYRVVTNLNGKSLDKYRSENDNTDKYFNKGYGKMYLMR